MDDVRYLQRFENFEKSYLLLKQAVEINNPSIFEKAGVIQFFETTFELSWKLMKDYMEFLGYEINSPRNAIKQAFSVNLLSNGELWLDALVDRNLTVHTYDEAVADKVYAKIKQEYFPLVNELYHKFKDEICLG